MSDVLDEAEWTARERRHTDRVDRLLGPHRTRAQTGQSHPVWDFLFTYYSFRPRQLARWHPGYGTALDGAAAGKFLRRTGYRQAGSAVTLSPDVLASRLGTVTFIADLLTATADRPARLNCFGMHEWAMVYRSREVRHNGVPLRLDPHHTDQVLESMPLRCSHFDAYRFFTDAAVGRNAEQLSRDAQLRHEQPGCVHANMDLYKWCYKLGPLVPSEMLMDCFELACTARLLDMRASPYDLTGYGITPIRIETTSGRTDYVRHQQEVARRAAELRTALRDHCRGMIAGDRAERVPG
ncbi:3-methyladenine DNA glycosylase [Mycolicibacterium sp. Y3]